MELYTPSLCLAVKAKSLNSNHFHHFAAAAMAVEEKRYDAVRESQIPMRQYVVMSPFNRPEL